MWVVGTHRCMRYTCVCACVFACVIVSKPMRTWVRAYKCKNACVNMFSYF